MKILCTSERDYDDMCQDYVEGEAGKRIIQEGFTHIMDECEGYLSILEVTVIYPVGKCFDDVDEPFVVIGEEVET